MAHEKKIRLQTKIAMGLNKPRKKGKKAKKGGKHY